MEIGMLVNQIIWGLLIGVGYSLLAIGFWLIFASTGAVNFAQGEFAMVGAYFFYTFLTKLKSNIFLAVILSLVICFAFGVILERIAFRKLYKLDTTLIVICTIAVSSILKSLTLIIWGPDSFTLPISINLKPINIGTVVLIPKNIILLIIGIIVMVLFHLFMTKTKFGTSMRAVSQNQKAASLMGVNVQRSISITWGLGSLIAGIGGILIAFVYDLSIDMGTSIGMKGFASAVLGGFGNIIGAMFGGLTIGVIENLGAYAISYYFKDLVSFIILIIILLVKPTGLFIKKGSLRQI